MKKILVSLLVLVMCIPAVADVTITGTDEGSGVLKITVAPTGGAEVRGVALLLGRSAGDAVIDATGDVVTTGLNTNIDYFATNGVGGVVGDTPNGEGHSLADPANPGVIDPTGGIYDFSLCAGYLDPGGGQAGYAVDSFFDITYEITINSTVTIALDMLRGGVQGTNLGTVTIATPTVDLVVGGAETVSTPDTPTVLGGLFFGGSTPAIQELPVTTGGSTSSLGNPVEYRFDWGDGNISAWGAAVQNKGYATEGATYTINAQARTTNTLVESSWSADFTHTVGSECQKFNLTKRLGVDTLNNLNSSDLTELITLVNANRFNPAVFAMLASDEDYDARYNFDSVSSLTSGDLSAIITYVNADRFNAAVFLRICPTWP